MVILGSAAEHIQEDCKGAQCLHLLVPKHLKVSMFKCSICEAIHVFCQWEQINHVTVFTT